jgi:hypothetical protein
VNSTDPEEFGLPIAAHRRARASPPRGRPPGRCFPRLPHPARTGPDERALARGPDRVRSRPAPDRGRTRAPVPARRPTRSRRKAHPHHAAAQRPAPGGAALGKPRRRLRRGMEPDSVECDVVRSDRRSSRTTRSRTQHSVAPLHRPAYACRAHSHRTARIRGSRRRRPAIEPRQISGRPAPRAAYRRPARGQREVSQSLADASRRCLRTRT